MQRASPLLVLGRRKRGAATVTTEARPFPTRSAHRFCRPERDLGPRRAAEGGEGPGRRERSQPSEEAADTEASEGTSACAAGRGLSIPEGGAGAHPARKALRRHPHGGARSPPPAGRSPEPRGPAPRLATLPISTHQHVDVLLLREEGAHFLHISAKDGLDQGRLRGEPASGSGRRGAGRGAGACGRRGRRRGGSTPGSWLQGPLAASPPSPGPQGHRLGGGERGAGRAPRELPARARPRPHIPGLAWRRRPAPEGRRERERQKG